MLRSAQVFLLYSNINWLNLTILLLLPQTPPIQMSTGFFPSTHQAHACSRTFTKPLLCSRAYGDSLVAALRAKPLTWKALPHPAAPHPSQPDSIVTLPLIQASPSCKTWDPYPPPNPPWLHKFTVRAPSSDSVHSWNISFERLRPFLLHTSAHCYFIFKGVSILN